MFPTAILCGVMELIGWGARLWSHSQPGLSTPFVIQTSVLVLAPTPLLAGIFVIFGRVIQQLGYRYSRLSPRTCAYQPVLCDCWSTNYNMSYGRCDLILHVCKFPLTRVAYTFNLRTD